LMGNRAGPYPLAGVVLWVDLWVGKSARLS